MNLSKKYLNMHEVKYTVHTDLKSALEKLQQAEGSLFEMNSDLDGDMERESKKIHTMVRKAYDDLIKFEKKFKNELKSTSFKESFDLSDKNLLDNKKWAFFDKLDSGNTFVVVDLGKNPGQDQYFMMVVDPSGKGILKKFGTHPSLKGASTGFYKNRKKEIEAV